MNLRPVLAALAVVLLFAAGCAHQQASRELRKFRGNIVENPAADPVFADARSSVVAVESFDAKGRLTGYGTGFYFGTDRIGTCLHVIDSAHSLQVVLADGSRFPVAGLFGADPLTDLAVLWVTNPPPGNRVLAVRSRPPEIGEAIQAIAAPRQLPITVTRGQVLGQFQLGTVMMNEAVELSVPAMPGFSGGPALDAEGRVVGVMSAVFGTSSGKASMAVPTGALGELAGPMTPPLTWDLWRETHPGVDPAVIALLNTGDELASNRPELALTHYNQALRKDSNCIRAWVRKGHCLFRLGRYADAAGSFSRALALEPGMIQPRLFLSFCLGLNHQPVEAERELAPLLSRRPDSPVVQSWQGVCRTALFDPVGALGHLQEAVRLAPDHPMARLSLGMLWDLHGETAAAEREFCENLRLQPANSIGQVSLACLFLETGRDEAAAALLADGKGLESQPRLHALRLLLAVKRGDARNVRRALKDYVAAERATPHPPKIRGIMDSLLRELESGTRPDVFLVERVGLGMLVSAHNHLAKAAFGQLTVMAPNAAENWYLLARASYLTGRLAEAERAARRALELRASHPGAPLILGQVYASRGEWDSARQWLNRALGLQAKNTEALMALAAVEARNGRPNEAAEFVAQARRAGGELPEALVHNPAAYFPDRSAIHAAANRN